MAKYKIIPSSRTIVQSPISIGHKAEKGVEAIEFDLTAWVETYGSGTLTVIMRRWGDAIPYPIALEIDENNKATWTLSDIDTAKAGMAYAQLSYIVGDEVVKKSDIYTFRVMDSLTGEGEPPEAYESWLEHLTHLAAEAMAEVLDIEGVATDKTLTVDGGIADAKATGDALSALEDAVTEETDKLKADLDDVNERIDDLKSALNDEFAVQQESSSLSGKYTLAIGAINKDTGSIGTSETYRAHTNGLKIFRPAFVYLSDSEFEYRIFVYDGNTYDKAIPDDFVSGAIKTYLPRDYVGKIFIICLRKAGSQMNSYDFTNNLVYAANKINIMNNPADVYAENMMRGPIAYSLESGGFNASGEEVNEISRARTGFFAVSREDIWETSNDVEITFYYYDQNYTYIGRTESWISAGNQVKPFRSNSSYYRALFRYSDNRAILSPYAEIQGYAAYSGIVNNARNYDIATVNDKRIAKIESDQYKIKNIEEFRNGVINMLDVILESTTRVYSQEYYRIDEIINVFCDNDIELTWRVYNNDYQLIYYTPTWGYKYATIKNLTPQNVYLTANYITHGTINLNNGLNSEQNVTNRARTIDYLDYVAADTISVSENYQYSLRFYDANKEYVGGTSEWNATSQTIAEALASTSVSTDNVAYYRVVFRLSTNDTLPDLTSIFGQSKPIQLVHAYAPVYWRVSARYSDDRTITDAQAVQNLVYVIADLSNHALDNRINKLDRRNTVNFASGTGNSTIRAVKEQNYSDGTDPVVEWYLLEEVGNNKFYYSKDLKSKTYLFTFVGDTSDYSFGIDQKGNIIACFMAASLTATPDPDHEGYYIGNDSQRVNPYVFLADEQWAIQHTINFGSSALKPCGWLGNSGFRNLPDGSTMFAEYTRPSVETCNAWKIEGNVLNPANWRVVHSQTLSGSNSYGIKHYHCVQVDQYSGVVYLATGDDDDGAAVDYSLDNGENWTRCTVDIDGTAHSTSEKYFRLVNYIFTKDYVYWSADTNISAYHKIFRIERRSNGVIDYSTATVIGNLPRYSQDGTLNSQSTYANVYLPSLNAILFLERVDGGTSATISKVPIRLIDLSEQISSDTPDGEYTSNVHEIYELQRVSANSNWNLGFRYAYADFYPKGNTVHVGFYLRKAKFGNSSINVNKGFGNTADMSGAGENNINNLTLRIYKNGTQWGVEMGTEYI